MNRGTVMFAAFALLEVFRTSARSEPVEILPAEFRGAMQPQVSVARNGDVHVVFGKDGAVYHSASTDQARTFAAPKLIAALPKLALGMRRGPRIVATDAGLIVTAISHEDGNLHAWRFDEKGDKWAEMGTVNDVPKSAREGLHAMSAHARGMVAVTWLDLRNGGMEVWSAVSLNAGRTWGGNVRVYQSPDGHVCECCHPSIAIDESRSIAVMFRNWLGGSRDMYLAISRDQGRTFAPAEKLGASTWKLNGCPMDGGAVAFSAGNNRPVAVWRREKEIFLSDDAHPERRLAPSGLQPHIVSGLRGPCVLWQEGGALMRQNGSGAPTRFAEHGAFPASAALPGGAAVVVWESGADAERKLLADVLRVER